MRNFFYPAACVLVLSCGGSAKDPSGPPRVYYPYAAHYTDEYAAGKPELSKKVLQLWRAHDRGDLMPYISFFAPETKLVFPDGTIQGKRDSVLHLWQQKRSGLSNVQSFVDSWLPVRAIERNEQLVFVWARQVRANAQGSQSWISVHQIWWFNKQEQVTSMYEYITGYQ